MPSGDSIAVKIGADSAGFRAGAQEAQDQTRALIDAMKALTDAMAKQGHGAKEAGEHVGGLSAKLREFKSEHVQTARSTRFFSNEIEHLGLVSGETSGALGALIAGFAIGGPIGVAIGTAKLLVEGVHSLGEESAKEAEEIKKLAEESKKFLEGQAKALEDFLAALEHETEAAKIARKEARPLLEQETKLVGELSAARTALQTATEEEVIDEQALARKMFEQARATKEVARIEAELAIVRANQAGVRKRIGGTAAGEDAASDSAAATAAAAKHRKTLEEAINDVLRKQGEIQSHLNDLEAEELALRQAKIQSILKDAAEEEDAAQKAHDEEMRLAAEEIAGEMQLRKDAADEAEALAEADAKKLAHEIGQAAIQMGQAAGQAFLGMIDGTKSVSDALVQLLGQMIEAALRMAALREIASGDFIGGGLLVAGSVVAGGLGSITGGGNRSSNITINQHFPQGSVSPGAASLEFQRGLVSTIRDLQRRGRL